MIFEFSEMLLDEIFRPIPVCIDLLKEYERLKEAITQLKNIYSPLQEDYLQKGDFRLKQILPDDPDVRINPESVKDLWKITPSQEARKLLKHLHPQIKGYIPTRLTRAKKERLILQAWERFWDYVIKNPSLQEELLQLLTNPKPTPLLI